MMSVDKLPVPATEGSPERHSSRYNLSEDLSIGRVPFVISECDHRDCRTVCERANVIMQKASYGRAQTHLHWLERPKTCLLVKRFHDKQALRDLLVLCRLLVETHKLNVVIEPKVHKRLQRVAANLKLKCAISDTAVSTELSLESAVVAESTEECDSEEMKSEETEKSKAAQFIQLVSLLQPFDEDFPGAGVDFAIVVGGDGTLLYLVSLFQKEFDSVPPILCFGRGSLGFLTPYAFGQHPSILENLLTVGKPQHIDVRMRLHCAVYRRLSACECESTVFGDFLTTDELPAKDSLEIGARTTLSSDKHKSTPIVRRLSTVSSVVTQDSLLRAYFCAEDCATKGLVFEHKCVEQFHALNEILVHRAKAVGMLELKLHVDEHYLTKIQSDGLIINTPTGSTAYAVSAGGSLIGPSVPCIGITSICPHTLSFRPIVIPDSSLIFITVPETVRYEPQIGFDGRSPPFQLRKGDIVVVQQSSLPVTTFKAQKSQGEWLSNLVSKFNWNLRVAQKPLGTKDLATDTAAGKPQPAEQLIDDSLLFAGM